MRVQVNMFKQLFILLVSAVYIISAFQKTTYTYKTVGDLNILADVYVPDKSLYNKYPVLFATHGGGFVIGDKNSWLFPSRARRDHASRLGSCLY